MLASSATTLCEALGSFPLTFRTRFLGGARSCLLADASLRALKVTTFSSHKSPNMFCLNLMRYVSCLSQQSCVVGKKVYGLDYCKADGKIIAQPLPRRACQKRLNKRRKNFLAATIYMPWQPQKRYISQLHACRQFYAPDVLIVGVEGGVVAGGLRGQVERRGRRHRLPPRRHLQALSIIHSKALLI